tara:strand:- start:591 stop:956 length:366 start_codon:yes stop_codon:yes gene_type:complete
MKPNYFLLFNIVILSYSCSLDRIPEVNDFFSTTINEKTAQPKDSIQYNCSEKKIFYLFYLNEGKSIWLVLPDREFKLSKIEESQNIYSNNITTLEISSKNTQIRSENEILYDQCTMKKSEI